MICLLVVGNRTCDDSSCNYNGKCIETNGLITCRYVCLTIWGYTAVEVVRVVLNAV